MPNHRREFLTALTASAAAALAPKIASGQRTPATKPTTTKEVVTGIGGFFYRAHDPRALEQWYHEHLGIPTTPQTLTDPVWHQQAGQTLFSAFSETTKYFDVTKQFMINFRVNDLARLVAQLQAAGVTVKVDPETYPNGRFAHLHDPEGNPIELWQPMGASAA